MLTYLACWLYCYVQYMYKLNSSGIRQFLLFVMFWRSVVPNQCFKGSRFSNWYGVSLAHHPDIYQNIFISSCSWSADRTCSQMKRQCQTLHLEKSCKSTRIKLLLFLQKDIMVYDPVLASQTFCAVKICIGIFQGFPGFVSVAYVPKYNTSKTYLIII